MLEQVGQGAYGIVCAAQESAHRPMSERGAGEGVSLAMVLQKSCSTHHVTESQTGWGHALVAKYLDIIGPPQLAG